MAQWTFIDPNTLLPGDPWTSAKAQAAFENLEAVAEGAPGAPKIQYAALDEGLAQQPAGGLGTYAFAWRNSTATPPAFGATVAGSQLRPAGFTSFGGVGTSPSDRTSFPESADILGSGGISRSTFAGTWRCMGEAIQVSSALGNYPHTLWLRIS